MLTHDARIEIASIITITVLAAIFVMARVVIRHKSRLLGADDWLLITGLALLFISDAGGFMLAADGEGVPVQDVPMSQLKLFLKGSFFPQVVYSWMTPIIKLSILWSYNRIFRQVPHFTRAVQVIGALVLGWWLGVFLTVMLECDPIQKNWEPELPGHCIDDKAFFLGNSIANNILDAAVLFMPVIPVLRLQMSSARKALVVASFMLGSLSTAASILRTVSITSFKPVNPTGTVIKASVWTYVEPGCAIIAACLPFLANISLKKLQSRLKALSEWTMTLLRGTRSRSHQSISDMERPGSSRDDSSSRQNGLVTHSSSPQDYGHRTPMSSDSVQLEEMKSVVTTAHSDHQSSD